MDGCDDVRDLGGLPTARGGQTARGRMVRANNLDLLTQSGWQVWVLAEDSSDALRELAAR